MQRRQQVTRWKLERPLLFPPSVSAFTFDHLARWNCESTKNGRGTRRGGGNRKDARPAVNDTPSPQVMMYVKVARQPLSLRDCWPGERFTEAAQRPAVVWLMPLEV